MIWLDGGVFQRNGQTCPAAFVQFGRGWLSCARRWRSKAADGARHWAGDCHLGQLEGDAAGVADDTCPDLDQWAPRFLTVFAATA